MKNKKLFMGGILTAVIGIVLIGIALAIWLCRGDENPDTLEKIAYDHSKKNPVVYIKENDEYVPYLVLTSDYDGNVLLLRENVLPEEMPYERSVHGRKNGAYFDSWASDEYGSYYEESSIDEFLNTDFLDRFSPDMQAAIMDTRIEVTDKASYGKNQVNATHMIERKVFLLSAVELGVNFSVGTSIVEEGASLKYFKTFLNKQNSERAAYKADGEVCPYWTRTPNVWETTYNVIAIGVEDELIDAFADQSDIGVRPAFCLSKDTVVQKSDSVIAGKSVYFIEY